MMLPLSEDTGDKSMRLSGFILDLVFSGKPVSVPFGDAW